MYFFSDSNLTSSIWPFQRFETQDFVFFKIRGPELQRKKVFFPVLHFFFISLTYRLCVPISFHNSGTTVFARAAQTLICQDVFPFPRQAWPYNTCLYKVRSFLPRSFLSKQILRSTIHTYLYSYSYVEAIISFYRVFETFYYLEATLTDEFYCMYLAILTDLFFKVFDQSSFLTFFLASAASEAWIRERCVAQDRVLEPALTLWAEL